jgi:hypothetical protein
MNAKGAREKGYSFTGIYERSMDPVKVRAAELRKQGFKCVVVTEPDSKLSRGPKGVGYSVYAEQKYFVVKDLKTQKNKLEGIKLERERVLRELEEKEQRTLECVNKLEEKLLQLI